MPGGRAKLPEELQHDDRHRLPRQKGPPALLSQTLCHLPQRAVLLGPVLWFVFKGSGFRRVVVWSCRSTSGRHGASSTLGDFSRDTALLQLRTQHFAAISSRAVQGMFMALELASSGDRGVCSDPPDRPVNGGSTEIRLSTVAVGSPLFGGVMLA